MSHDELIEAYSWAIERQTPEGRCKVCGATLEAAVHVIELDNPDRIIRYRSQRDVPAKHRDESKAICVSVSSCEAASGLSRYQGIIGPYEWGSARRRKREHEERLRRMASMSAQSGSPTLATSTF